MREPDDNDPTPRPRRMRVWPLVLVTALVAVAFLLTWRVVNEPRASGEPPRFLPPQSVPSIEDTPPGISLDDGDTRLKQVATGWSSDPVYTRWLGMLSLRHLVAAAQLMADGENVKPSLPFLYVGGAFVVREEKIKRGEARLFIAPATYDRYATLSRVLGSVSAGDAGDAYAAMRPYCQAAFGEIGRPGKQFDEVLTAAIGRVMSVQFPEGAIELVPRGAVYAFKDPALEGLTVADKQVLRMGPKNGGVLQRQLREFATRAKLNVTVGAR